ncbi:hypothetical protein GE061_013176, partial [Apolygus lucorum]
MAVKLEKFVVALLATITCIEAATKGYYRAAVVEHSAEVPTNPIKRMNAEEKLLEKINYTYEHFISRAHDEEADIVVFPEAGLYGSDYTLFNFIPHPSLKIVPADSTECDKPVRLLSALARKYSIYVVVNLLEQYKHSDGRITKYVTNVVFDRKGRVVARYKKFNLFGEPVNRTANIGPSYFDADFGVRFGQLLGLDILYKEPAFTLMKEYNVTNFIHSSQWFSELPFLASVQAQWMWSVGNEVNLLASGLGHIEHGTSGSGIYRGKNTPLGSLYVFCDVLGGSIVIGNVSTGGTRLDYSGKGELSSKYRRDRVKFPLFKQEELELMANADIDLPADKSKAPNDLQIANIQKHLCHELLCCNFNLDVFYRMNGLKVQYKVVVFDGTRISKAPYTKLVQGVQICGIVLCKDKSMGSCGPPAVDGRLPNIGSPKPSINFTLIEISGNFTKDDSSIMPNLLLWPNIPDPLTDGIVDDFGEFLLNPKVVNFTANYESDALSRFLFEVISIKGEATTSSYYRAAVVEHPPTIKHSNAVQNLRETIDQYGFFIEKAHSQKADIIVFPEAGLFGKNFLIFHVLPKKQEDYTPDEHIGRLSTFARNFSMYVAVTVLERYTHSNNKTRMYITAVIFNRRGVIVCCYRKFHLFGERVDVTNDVSPTYFDTDFGVRFGLLIGLDILFKHPASALMKEKNVTDFIYTTKWSSELPFSTAVQAQWMWSVGNEVNLIAAGLNCMELGSSGSGIYRGKSFP